MLIVSYNIMLALVLFIKLHIIEQVKRLTEPFDLVIDYDM